MLSRRGVGFWSLFMASPIFGAGPISALVRLAAFRVAKFAHPAKAETVVKRAPRHSPSARSKKELPVPLPPTGSGQPKPAFQLRPRPSPRTKARFVPPLFLGVLFAKASKLSPPTVCLVGPGLPL
ncbi:hypothetical protein TRVL_08791 [Trypanosoma vivax]|nr:hypothetical protein TRVL_08791 [Trypanosoma vivax]